VGTIDSSITELREKKMATSTEQCTTDRRNTREQRATEGVAAVAAGSRWRQLRAALYDSMQLEAANGSRERKGSTKQHKADHYVMTRGGKEQHEENCKR
jgi:hypothetical protein